MAWVTKALLLVYHNRDSFSAICPGWLATALGTRELSTNGA
jgi:hypothetical protein